MHLAPMRSQVAHVPGNDPGKQRVFRSLHISQARTFRAGMVQESSGARASITAGSELAVRGQNQDNCLDSSTAKTSTGQLVFEKCGPYSLFGCQVGQPIGAQVMCALTDAQVPLCIRVTRGLQKGLEGAFGYSS